MHHIWLKSVPIPIPGIPAGGVSGITHQPWFYPAIVAIIITFGLAWVTSSLSKRAAVFLTIVGTIAVLAFVGAISLHK